MPLSGVAKGGQNGFILGNDSNGGRIKKYDHVDDFPNEDLGARFCGASKKQNGVRLVLIVLLLRFAKLCC